MSLFIHSTTFNTAGYLQWLNNTRSHPSWQATQDYDEAEQYAGEPRKRGQEDHHHADHYRDCYFTASSSKGDLTLLRDIPASG